MSLNVHGASRIYSPKALMVSGKMINDATIKSEYQKHDLIMGLAIAAVAFLIYANSLGNGFVWDDDIVILANSAQKVNPVELFSGLDRGRMTETTPYYRPVTLLSFLVEERLHGFTPYLVRLVNVLLHCVNTFLVYRFIRTFNVHYCGALLAGLLFAVHPLHSEAVDFNAGGRNTMLAVFFILASYLVHHWSVRRNSFWGALAGASLFLTGLFSKETALAILPFIGALEVSGCRGEVPDSRRNAFMRFVPYMGCLALYLALRHNALSRGGASVEILPGLVSRLQDNVFILPRYLLNVVWPQLLSPKYYVPEDVHLYMPQLAVAWIFIVTVLCWLLIRARSYATLFGLAWMVAFWLPVSGIFPIPSAPLADRYLYAPAIGLWLVFADQAARLAACRDGIKRIGIVAASTILVAMAIVTIRHNLTWHDDIALFSRLTALYPERAYGYHNLGCAYLDKVKNLDRAEKSFEQALSLDPFFPRLRTQMGYVRLMRGDLEGALSHYNQAIYMNPLDSEALLNRGDVFERLGRRAEALDSYRRFLALPVNDLPQARQDVAARILRLERSTAAK